jgi:PA14 domain
VRVFIDNQPIIDQWHEGSGSVEYTADRSMYGNQSVRVEHYEASGQASLAFSFTLLANTTIDGGGSGDWAAQYYNNTDLSGNPVLVRREPRQPYPLDQDWGNGSPAPGVINDDNWSARWVGTFGFDSGDYMFQARTDDGVRVYIDGIRVIDAWSDGFKQPSNQFKRLGAGNHQITVEYYERGGTAFNRVWWSRVTGNGGGGSNDHSNRDQ